MLLVIAATDQEIAGLRERFASHQGLCFLKGGIGLVETTCSLTGFLERQGRNVTGVLNIGVGGAFACGPLTLLDLAVASAEVIGDLGICFEGRLAPLASPGLDVHRLFSCQGALFDRFRSWCRHRGQEVHVGPFVSVNCVSGTRQRGDMLAATHDAICENMEGAAVARVCQRYGVDWLELRCMSNMVEDRDTSAWRLPEAAARCAEVAGHFLTDSLRT
jgi:futalosine hydrolase